MTVQASNGYNGHAAGNGQSTDPYAAVAHPSSYSAHASSNAAPPAASGNYAMTADEYRQKHDLIVQGYNCPDPVQTFEGAGFSRDILDEVSSERPGWLLRSRLAWKVIEFLRTWGYGVWEHIDLWNFERGLMSLASSHHGCLHGCPLPSWLHGHALRQARDRSLWCLKRLQGCEAVSKLAASSHKWTAYCGSHWIKGKAFLLLLYSRRALSFSRP